MKNQKEGRFIMKEPLVNQIAKQEVTKCVLVEDTLLNMNFKIYIFVTEQQAIEFGEKIEESNDEVTLSIISMLPPEEDEDSENPFLVILIEHQDKDLEGIDDEQYDDIRQSLTNQMKTRMLEGMGYNTFARRVSMFLLGFKRLFSRKKNKVAS
jgi:hypothetical protein